jgi:ketosteroid isomerase-like protein
MGHPNEMLLRRAYEAQARGDLDGYIDLLADDFVLHIPVGSRIAGDYRGKDEVRRHFREIAELSEGTFRIIWRVSRSGYHSPIAVKTSPGCRWR